MIEIEMSFYLFLIRNSKTVTFVGAPFSIVEIAQFWIKEIGGDAKELKKLYCCQIW
jgi:hypothetical protein